MVRSQTKPQITSTLPIFRSKLSLKNNDKAIRVLKHFQFIFVFIFEAVISDLILQENYKMILKAILHFKTKIF